jgi:hypothetical protein
VVGAGVELLNEEVRGAMYKYFAITIANILFALSSPCSAQNAIPEITPFDSYPQVANRIYVYDKSQYSPYNGPDITHWELLLPHSRDDNNHEFDRKRLGVVTLTPTLKVYVDAIWDPMSEYYELRDTKNGKLIHQFRYKGAAWGLLLFSGQGAVYEFRQIDELCHGNTTNKYVYKNEKLTEIALSMQFLNDAESEVLGDTQLLIEPKANNSYVASLPKGTKVTVLALKYISKSDPRDSWFLIKTPLGLTGWVTGGLEITTCY